MLVGEPLRGPSAPGPLLLHGEGGFWHESIPSPRPVTVSGMQSRDQGHVLTHCCLSPAAVTSSPQESDHMVLRPLRPDSAQSQKDSGSSWKSRGWEAVQALELTDCPVFSVPRAGWGRPPAQGVGRSGRQEADGSGLQKEGGLAVRTAGSPGQRSERRRSRPPALRGLC